MRDARLIMLFHQSFNHGSDYWGYGLWGVRCCEKIAVEMSIYRVFIFVNRRFIRYLSVLKEEI